MQSGLHLAFLKPAAPPVTHQSGIITVVVVEMFLCLVFMVLFKLFLAWQCSAGASWCTLSSGMPRFSRGR